MSNIKVIFIILINTLFISLCTIKLNNHHSLAFLLPLLGVANNKYLASNARITKKQKNTILLFFLASIIVFIIIIDMRN